MKRRILNASVGILYLIAIYNLLRAEYKSYHLADQLPLVQKMKNVRFKKVLALIDSIINKRPDGLICQGLQEAKGKGQEYVSPLPFYATLFKSNGMRNLLSTPWQNSTFLVFCQVRDYAPEFSSLHGSL